MAKREAECCTCGKKFRYTPSKTRGKYCSLECLAVFQRARSEARIVAGEAKTPRPLRAYLLRTRGAKCECCGIGDEWNGQPPSLHMDHIDGNSDNHAISNLRILCPNCHSQTETWRGRNKKRHSRNSYLQKYRKKVVGDTGFEPVASGV